MVGVIKNSRRVTTFLHEQSTSSKPKADEEKRIRDKANSVIRHCLRNRDQSCRWSKLRVPRLEIHTYIQP